MKKTRGVVKGGGRRESSLQLKRSALSFKVSFREAGLWRSQGQREEWPRGRDGEVYISFRSSRVWSSILCVQRCSSLVHFSLYRGHVIEGVVQLVANGLVLQFLGIELVWTGTGTTGMMEGIK